MNDHESHAMSGPDSEQAQVAVGAHAHARVGGRRVEVVLAALRRHYVLVVATIYLVLSAALVIPTALVTAHDMSMLDEPTHADYAFQLSHLHIPAKGDYLATEVREHWRWVGLENVPLPAGDVPPPQEFPNGGYQYNYTHPPLYYAITGVFARAVVAVVPGLDFVDAARLLGVFWLAGGMFLMFQALRRWELSRRLSAIIPLFFLCIPLTTHAASTVTPDAPVVLAGAAALWVAADLYKKSRVSYVLLGALTAIAALTKILNALPFLAIAGVLLLSSLFGKGRSDRAWRRLGLWSALTVMATFAAVYLGWSVFQNGRGDPAWVNPVLATNAAPLDGFPLVPWLPRLFSGFEMMADYWIQPALRSEIWQSWTALLGYLLIASGFMVLVSAPKGSSRRYLAWSLMLGCASVALIVNLQWYVVTEGQYYFPWPSRRYALPMVPMALACLTMGAKRAGLIKVLVGFCGLGLAISFVTAYSGFLT